MSRTRSQLLMLLALCAFGLVLHVTTAHAANYRMLLCAGNNGSNSFDTATNTVSGANPGGIFSFENYCGPAGDPAGNGAFLRLAENQSGGNAGNSAYGSISWTVPPWVAILAGGGYTREPGSFNDGWRGRFWAEDFGGGGHHILLQGTGVPNGSNGGIGWGTTSTFASHLWPFPTYGYYRRFIFEMTCFRPAGCDRSGWNAVDANTIHLTLADVSPASVGFGGDAILSGAWARGTQNIGWSSSDQGSGMRFERLRLDGAQLSANDYGGQCDLGWSQASGEFARVFQPCPVGGPWGHGYGLNTASVPDGGHTLQVCAQDYSQAAGLDATAGESCDQRAIHTDNTAPGKPAALAIRSANPDRYLDHFGATFSLPPDPGSPIARVHYMILNAEDEAVVPERLVSATNPTEVAAIQGPKAPGAYRLKLWLEDSVGFQGPAAEVAIPHDTTPPAAPQGLRSAGSTSRWLDKLNLRWANIVDAGSPIDAAHYRFLDPSGEPVGSTETISGENPEAIDGLLTPTRRGRYEAQVWLEDAEGNVGAAASVPLPIDTTPPAAPQRLQVAAPDTPRSRDGFDLHWRNIGDDGSPVDAAHYEVLDGSGHLAVPEQTERRTDVSSIADIHAPDSAGAYTLKLWLQDAEGNAGAPATVSLSYECARSPVGSGAHLDAALSDAVVQQGQGSTLKGALRESSGAPVAGAPLCVFEQVEGERARHYLGLAYTDAAGNYGFGVTPGPNRT
ncbi:MAG TPA: carboxypeptidase-like regulatory domain-containing protein, partial [Solirubrobacterales bacterium]|nr:carboxypeptidase-like regulatory domain-containing protein [Solirubrobacterales bacterium]